MSAHSSSPGLEDSTCRSLKQGLYFSIFCACSAVSSIPSSRCRCSTFIQRSYTLAIPLRIRIFCTVGKLTDTPLIFRESDSFTHPHDGCSRLASRIFASVSGAVAFGWLLMIGGKSFSPSRPCAWKRRFNW